MTKKKSGNWFQKGSEGWSQAKREDEAAKQRREQQTGPWRFRLKNDTAAKITFLDTPDFFCHEHNLKIDKRYGNFFTCLKDFDTCPPCEDGTNPAYIVVGTVIDHSTYVDKDGKSFKNQKKLFVGKGRARQRLMRQIDLRDGDLQGAVYEMARGSSQTECATGEDFEFMGKLTKAKLKKLIPAGKDEEWLKPFDYMELFAPLDADKLRAIVGGEAPVGSETDDDSGEETTDTDGGFDEDETREELEAITTKTKLKKWAKDNDLDIDFGPLKSTDKEEMVDQIIEAMAEAEEENGEASDDTDGKTEEKSDDDLSIDDLI